MTHSYTDLLYARPSFLEGMSRLLDLGCTLQEYNTAVSPEQADFLAIRADWHAVGADLLHSMRQIGDEANAGITAEVIAEARNKLKGAPRHLTSANHGE